MYEEFIIGYVISGVAVILLAVVIVLQCIILKRMSHGDTSFGKTAYTSYTKSNTYNGENRGTAVCRNCATQYDAVHKICPKCGTPRS